MSKKKRTIVIVSLIIMAIVAVVTIAFRTLNQPSLGSVSIDRTTAASSATPSPPTTISTAFYRTITPAGFSLKQQTDVSNSQILSRVVATGDRTAQLQLAITVGILPSEGFSGIGDYNLRASQSASYTPVSLAGLPPGARAFRAITSPPSLCVFWQSGGNYNEIAISASPGTADQALQAVSSQLIGSWQQK